MERVAKRKSSVLLENAKTIVYAGLIAIGIRTFFFEPFNIPSASMVPTLLVGDYLFVSKYSYGYSQYSMPLSFPPFAGRILGGLPKQGDIVVFRQPGHESIDFIKRVVALPGQKVQVRGGELYIDGAIVPRTAAGHCMDEDGHYESLTVRYQETLPDGVKHYICKVADPGAMGSMTYQEANDTPVFSVPAGTFFAMGDNRDNSADSRFQPSQGGVGFVPMENLVGRAEFLFFSVDATAPWWQFWRWPFEIRWDRLFNSLR